MTRGARHFHLRLMAAAALLLAAPPSFAAPRDQQKWCEGKEDASPDLRITSCTAIIETRNVKKQQKAEALSGRGKAYRAKGDSENAIRDFDEALTLDSRDAESYFNRG